MGNPHRFPQPVPPQPARCRQGTDVPRLQALDQEPFDGGSRREIGSVRRIGAPRGLKGPRPGPSPRVETAATHKTTGRGPEPRVVALAFGMTRRVSAHAGHGPMARTTATMTFNVTPARRPESGLTKRQTHSQAEMHSKGMAFLAKTDIANRGGSGHLRLQHYVIDSAY